MANKADEQSVSEEQSIELQGITEGALNTERYDGVKNSSESQQDSGLEVILTTKSGSTLTQVEVWNFDYNEHLRVLRTAKPVGNKVEIDKVVNSQKGYEYSVCLSCVMPIALILLDKGEIPEKEQKLWRRYLFDAFGLEKVLLLKRK
ncbi:MAG: hypothetical protein LBC64_09215 [Fibromonadaceae bacterium]|jgi:hypothetical protein|nr:hypothetical protein [Fibromonadaceae bacterium]